MFMNCGSYIRTKASSHNSIYFLIVNDEVRYDFIVVYLIGIVICFTNKLAVSKSQQMCRMIGYLGGIVLFIVLGVQKLKGYQLYYATAIINLICIALVIIFRILAKYMNGFWEIWWKRMQRQVVGALSCLGHYTQMPEYEITTTTIDRYGNKAVQKSTTCNTFIFGCIQCIVCAVLTVISPLILAFLLFCYVQAIIHQCRWREKQKAKNEIKEEQIARQSARMTLRASLNKNYQAPTQSNNESVVNNYVGSYPAGQESVNQPYANNNYNQQLAKDKQPEIITVQQPQQNYDRKPTIEIQYGNIQQTNVKNDEL